jgi:hypothetical protein
MEFVYNVINHTKDVIIFIGVFVACLIFAIICTFIQRRLDEWSYDAFEAVFIKLPDLMDNVLRGIDKSECIYGDEEPLFIADTKNLQTTAEMRFVMTQLKQKNRLPEKTCDDFLKWLDEVDQEHAQLLEEAARRENE